MRHPPRRTLHSTRGREYAPRPFTLFPTFFNFSPRPLPRHYPLDIAIARNHKRLYPILLRAGARHVTTFAMDLGYNHVYFQEIAACGGFKKFEQKHREDLAAMLAPKLPRIPKDVIPLVVDYWAHVGDYPYFVSSDDFDTENETEDEWEDEGGRYGRPDYSSR